jgi:hypothetical protein
MGAIVRIEMDKSRGSGERKRKNTSAERDRGVLGK